MPPRIDPLDRLSRHLDVSRSQLETTFQQWPAANPFDHPCWPAKRMFSYQQRPVRTIRAIMAELLGEMHTDWKVQQICPTLNCCQPLHLRLVTIRRTDPSLVPHPLPDLSHKRELRAAVTSTGYTLEDVISIIESDGLRIHPAARIAEILDEPIELIDRALAPMD